MRKYFVLFAALVVSVSLYAKVEDASDPNLQRSSDGVDSAVNQYGGPNESARIPQSASSRSPNYVTDVRREGASAGYKSEYLECTKTAEASVMKMGAGMKCGNQDLCIMPVRCTIEVSSMGRTGRTQKFRVRGEKTAACLFKDNRCPAALDCMKEKLGEVRSESTVQAGMANESSINRRTQ